PFVSKRVERILKVARPALVYAGVIDASRPGVIRVDQEVPGGAPSVDNCQTVIGAVVPGPIVGNRRDLSRVIEPALFNVVDRGPRAIDRWVYLKKPDQLAAGVAHVINFHQ